MPGLCPVMSLIAADGLAVRMGGREVVHGVDLAIDPGEVVTIVGPNGSGKTTLLRALIGAVDPSHGKVRHAPGLVIGYVPQRLELGPSLPLTVARFLTLPRGRSRDQIDAVLDRVGGGGLARAQMAELSGGQFQRVLLARALLREPQILVMDEPTQSLDQPGIAAFYSLIEQVRVDLGCAVLMVSHDLLVVMRASDRVICLNGHICCEGSPVDVSAAPEYRALFGAPGGEALALYQHVHDHSHDHQNHRHGDHAI